MSASCAAGPEVAGKHGVRARENAEEYRQRAVRQCVTVWALERTSTCASSSKARGMSRREICCSTVKAVTMLVRMMQQKLEVATRTWAQDVSIAWRVLYYV